MTDTTLAGAAALVTGASSGIGAATARALAAQGAAVTLVARRRDRLEAVAAEITASGGTAYALVADISDQQRAARVVQDGVDLMGRLDILVNNAGVMLLGAALHTSLSEWDRMVQLNITALLHITHSAVPHLIDAAATSHRHVADIVNVSSTAGRVARPGSSAYTLTKWGLVGFSESLRQELLAERVRVSVIEPGTVDTELLDHLGEQTRAAARRQVSGIEPLRADDVADAITYTVTRDRRVAVNEVLIRAGDQNW